MLSGVDRNTLQKIGYQSYEPENIRIMGYGNGIKLVPRLSSLTIATYKNKISSDKFNFIISVRGTFDVRDARADLSLPYNLLTTTDRYKDDLELVKKIKNEYPNIDIHAVGHSLGGAIIDQLIKAGLVVDGLSYNPAVQNEDIQSDSKKNYRVYFDRDLIYLSMGQYLKVKPEVRHKEISIFRKIINYIPVVGELSELTESMMEHKMDNFKGGKLKVYCDICKKSFSKNYMKKHMATKIHRDNLYKKQLLIK